MALISAQRSQTLSALSIDFMNSTATGTQFVVNSLLKSSRPGKSSLVVSFPAFPENGKLCAHSTLLYYVARTASIRQSLNSSQVFVSYRKPYKVVSSATLARWLNVVLSLAGIDTSIFKGHSFRGASTSKAVSLGVPLDVILTGKTLALLPSSIKEKHLLLANLPRLFSHCSPSHRRCVFVSRIKCSLEKHSSFGTVYCARESTLSYAI